MNSFNTYFFALNSYRQFYQIGDTINNYRRLNSMTDKVIQVGIAAFDSLSHLMCDVVIPNLNKIIEKPFDTTLWRVECGLAEGGLRSLQILRSLYLLYKNPARLNRKDQQLQILMNILNIGRIALQILEPARAILPYARLALCGLDALLKVSSIKQKFNVELVVRSIINIGMISTLWASGLILAVTCVDALAPAALLSVTALAIGSLTHFILDTQFNAPHHSLRRSFEVTSTVLSSLSITTLALTKLGISTSLTHSVSLLGRGILWITGLVLNSLGIVAIADNINGRALVPTWNSLIHRAQYVALAMILAGVVRGN